MKQFISFVRSFGELLQKSLNAKFMVDSGYSYDEIRKFLDVNK